MSAFIDALTANDTPGAHPDSWYAATATPTPAFAPLAGEAKVDVAIIGAGYTGLSAAIRLADRGLSVALLEAHRVGWGASGRNGGQLGSGMRIDQIMLARMFGPVAARWFWDLSEEAKRLVRGLIARFEIPCDLRSGILHVEHRRRDVDDAKAYAAHLNDVYGYTRARFVDRPELAVMLGARGYWAGVLDEGAGHLHPLNFALGLARAAAAIGVRIHERSPVLAHGVEGKKRRVVTEGGAVVADHVILAANGYLGALEPRVARRVMPINNYIVATEPLDAGFAEELIRDDVAVADSRFVVNYFRLSADRRLLFGGRESYSYRFPADIKAYVRPRMLEIFPQLSDVEIEYGWGGTLAITRSRLPYLARLEPGLWSASGYSGHGVALATLCGAIVGEAITGAGDRFDRLAALPSQTFPGGAGLRWPLLVAAMAWFSLRDKL